MGYGNVVDAITSAIELAINGIKDKLHYDKSYTGKITGRQDSSYTVTIYGKDYQISSEFDFAVNSWVKVTAIQNNFQRLYLEPNASVLEGAGGLAEKVLFFDSNANIMTSLVCNEDLSCFDTIGLMCHMDGGSFYTRAIVRNGLIDFTFPGWTSAGYSMTYRVVMEVSGRNLRKTSELAYCNEGISETNRLRVFGVYGWKKAG